MHDPRLESELQQARQGRSMVAVWRVHNGRLLLYRKTQNFPVADFAKSVELLWENLQQATQPQPAGPGIWLPPGTDLEGDVPQAANVQPPPELESSVAAVSDQTTGSPLLEAPPVNEAPVDEAPVDEAPVDEAPVEEIASDETKADALSAEEQEVDGAQADADQPPVDEETDRAAAQRAEGQQRSEEVA